MALQKEYTIIFEQGPYLIIVGPRIPLSENPEADSIYTHLSEEGLIEECPSKLSVLRMKGTEGTQTDINVRIVKPRKGVSLWGICGSLESQTPRLDAKGKILENEDPFIVYGEHRGFTPLPGYRPTEISTLLNE